MIFCNIEWSKKIKWRLAVGAGMKLDTWWRLQISGEHLEFQLEKAKEAPIFPGDLG